MSRAIAHRAIRLLADRDGRTEHSPSEMLDLTLSEAPHLPAHVVRAAKDALDRGETHYTNRPGIPELRSTIAKVVRAEGIPASADTVVITNGGAEATYIALQSVLRPGDRVAVVEPISPNVVDMVQFIGAELVRIHPSSSYRFNPSVEDLPAAGAHALLLSSPSPISGVAIHPQEIQELLYPAVERGMIPILDRSLAPCVYDLSGQAFDDEGLMSQVITIGSFSTAYGLGGWRVGYFTAPVERAAELAKLKQAMSICTTAVSQFAALAALRGSAEWLDARRRHFADRKARVTERLAAVGLNVVDVDAYPSLLVQVGDGDCDDVGLTQRLREEAGVVVQAGSSFGDATRGLVRIDLGVDEDTLFAGIERIAAVLGNGASHGWG